MLRPFNAEFILGMNVLERISYLLGLLLIILKLIDVGPLGNWPWWVVLGPWWAWFTLQPIYMVFLEKFYFHKDESIPPSMAIVGGWFVFALTWLAMPYAIYVFT